MDRKTWPRNMSHRPSQVWLGYQQVLFWQGNLDLVQGDFLQKKFFEMTPNAFKAFLNVKEVFYKLVNHKSYG